MGEETARNDDVQLRSSDTNTDSDRVLVTKRAIFFALRDLVAERGFGDVSASDIIERAGISRSTFYRCFSDKYDVANWAYKRYKNIRLQDRDQYHSFKTGLRAQLEHLSENREFFASVLRYHGQNSLAESMIETNEEYMQQCWRATHNSEPPCDVVAAICFSAAGCSHVLERWVLDGCKQDCDAVADVICNCIPPAILETLY